MVSRLQRWWRSRTTRRHPVDASELPETLLAAMDELTRRFASREIDFAFIGGVAMALHGLARATKDVDLIVDRAAADSADATMLEVGFERLKRGDVFGNYLLGPLRVDLLFTKGAMSRRMLERATTIHLRRATSKLVCAEDLIGLKLQALANNRERPYDRGDIEALLRRFSDTMDMALVRDYFRLFEKEDELDALLAAIGRGS